MRWAASAKCAPEVGPPGRCGLSAPPLAPAPPSLITAAPVRRKAVAALRRHVVAPHAQLDVEASDGARVEEVGVREELAQVAEDSARERSVAQLADVGALVRVAVFEFEDGGEGLGLAAVPLAALVERRHERFLPVTARGRCRLLSAHRLSRVRHARRPSAYPIDGG